MPVMDEFREERAEIKNRSFQERLSYFWDYYKWYVIGGIAAAVFLGSLIYTTVTAKKTALSVFTINYLAQEDANAALSEPFLAGIGIDAGKYEVSVDTSYRETGSARTQADVASEQKLAVMIAAGDVDLLVAGQEKLLLYSYQDFFTPLADYYTEAELEALSDAAQALGFEPFFYIDRAVLREMELAEENGASYDLARVPDPTSPDRMEDPVAIGVRTDLFPRFTEQYIFLEERTASYIALLRNTSRGDTATAFLKFLRE